MNPFGDSVTPPDGDIDADYEGDPGSDGWSTDSLDAPGEPVNEGAPVSPGVGTLDEDPPGDGGWDPNTGTLPGDTYDDGAPISPEIGTLDRPQDETEEPKTSPTPGQLVEDSAPRAPEIGTLGYGEDDTGWTDTGWWGDTGLYSPEDGTDDPTSSSGDPNDPESGGSDDDPNGSGDDPDGSGDDPDGSGDDPDGSSDDPEGSSDDPDGNDDLSDEGCRTQGFWKNHRDAWPVSDMWLGDRYYTEDPDPGEAHLDELMDLLWMETNGDASMIMSHQLIAAKLNVAWGWTNSEIEATIEGSDQWLSQNADADGWLPFDVATNTPEGADAVLLGLDLDAFNNGHEECADFESALRISYKGDGRLKVSVAPFHRLGCTTLPGGPAPWALWVLLPLVGLRRRRAEG